MRSSKLTRCEGRRRKAEFFAPYNFWTVELRELWRVAHLEWNLWFQQLQKPIPVGDLKIFFDGCMVQVHASAINAFSWNSYQVPSLRLHVRSPAGTGRFQLFEDGQQVLELDVEAFSFVLVLMAELQFLKRPGCLNTANCGTNSRPKLVQVFSSSVIYAWESKMTQATMTSPW